jgi:hypothetical protein
MRSLKFDLIQDAAYKDVTIKFFNIMWELRNAILELHFLYMLYIQNKMLKAHYPDASNTATQET